MSRTRILSSELVLPHVNQWRSSAEIHAAIVLAGTRVSLVNTRLCIRRMVRDGLIEHRMRKLPSLYATPNRQGCGRHSHEYRARSTGGRA